MLTLFFTFLSCAFAATTDLPKAPVEGHFEIQGEFNYLDTTANFPSGGGASTSLPNGTKFTNEMVSGQGSYDFDRQFRVYGGVSGGQTVTNVFNPLINATEEHVKPGLNEMWVGARSWLPYSGFQIVPQLDFTYPLFRVDLTSDDALLGEGAMRLQAGSWILSRWQRFTPFGYLGFAYRDEGRSYLVPYIAGIRYGIRRKWWVQADVNGYQSVTDDSNIKNQSLRDAYLTHVDGSSYAYYGLNPNHTDIEASGGIQFGNLEVYGAFSVSAYGKSSADSWVGTIGVRFLGSLNSEASESTVRSSTPNRRKKQFDTQTEDYDDSLFQESDVTNTPKNEQMVEDQMGEDPDRPAPKVKKKKNNDPLPNVELLMKDTEKTLNKKPK